MQYFYTNSGQSEDDFVVKSILQIYYVHKSHLYFFCLAFVLVCSFCTMYSISLAPSIKQTRDFSIFYSSVVNPDPEPDRIRIILPDPDSYLF
jgi:hypothetical protein